MAERIRTDKDSRFAAWHARADELADWAWSRLVNRIDAWGGYSPVARRGQEYTKADGTKGKVPASYTRHGTLTVEHLARHFRAERAEHVLGTHTTRPDNTCLWGGYDIDQHGQGDAAANLRAAYRLYDALRDLHFAPLLTTSNGDGGFHLRVLFAEPVPCRDLFCFLAEVARRAEFTGEQFPKQQALTPHGAGSFGNWLRLPGRHHTRVYWSEVYDGEAWLAGERAVAFLLEGAGDHPAWLPAAPPPARKRRVLVLKASLGLADRIELYRRKLPNLGEGQGRDKIAYSFAAWLVRDLQLTDAVALEWLSLWDRGNTPPKGEPRLREVLENTKRYGKRAYGSGRSA